MIFFYPFRFVIEFDTDEGLSVIMAQMISQGFRLYSEVWSDHPPLFPIILSILLQTFSMNVTIARLFVLLLSCVLLWAVIQYLRFFWGSPHAIAGALLVIMLPYYTRLSVSVMIGLPSIVFAMLSFLSLAVWHAKRRYAFLLLSGIFLGISVMMKLQTGFLAIVFIMGLLFTEIQTYRKNSSRATVLKPALLWAMSFSMFIILVGIFLIGSEGLPQLVNVHLAAETATPFQNRSSILTLISRSWPIFLLALIGSIHAIRTKIWTALYLTSWIIFAFLLLTQLKPIWYHHQLLITIPAAILAAIPIGELIRIVRKKKPVETNRVCMGFFMSATLVTLALFLANRFPTTLRNFQINFPNLYPPSAPATPLQEMLALVSDYADETNILVTDRPMLAFRTGITVPPDLAVFSGKRFLTGLLTESDIINIIKATNPEQVALTRFYMPEVEKFLAERYNIKYNFNKYNLFFRYDLSSDENQ